MHAPDADVGNLYAGSTAGVLVPGANALARSQNTSRNHGRRLPTSGPIPPTVLRRHALDAGAATSPPRSHDRRGRPRKPAPAPAVRPVTGWVQPLLFDDLRRDYTRFDPREHVNKENPWLIWGHYLAHRLGETRGWSHRVRFDVGRALPILLSGHVEGDVVHYSAMFAALRARNLTADHVGYVLGEMGILIDDRQPSFEDWLSGKLDGIAAGIARETETWLRTLRDGGPRARPRSIGTVWTYAKHAARLSARTGSPTAAIFVRSPATTSSPPWNRCTAPTRQATLVALRVAVRSLQENPRRFHQPDQPNPGRGPGREAYPAPRPDQIQRTVNDAARPADRLIIALAAVHAVRSAATRALQLDDIDLGNRRLTIAARLSDHSTNSPTVCCWNGSTTAEPAGPTPPTRTCSSTIRAPTSWGRSAGTRLTAGFRGQHATLERLRVDRQLEEALTHGPDPLHLAVVFGLDEKTAIRYATAARQLLETPIEHHTPS